MTGDVIVEIYGKVEYSSTTEDLTGTYDNISFVGMTDDAEISITRNGQGGYIGGGVNDCNVSFTNLILSKPAGDFAGDAGFMNVYFTTYRTGNVTYTNCTFPNGACAQGTNDAYTATYTNCTFANTTSGKYSLWVYANCNVIVNGGSFTGIRGVKMYGEGASKTGNLELDGVTFTNSVIEKPAIVLTYGESVTIKQNNTFNNVYKKTGTATTFELDLEGQPNGTPINSELPITCYNDNGACGVLCDGKIYTTVADAAAVATSGSTVTLLHNSTETVTLPAGVSLNINGYTADGVTEAAPVEVSTYDELVAALTNDGAIKLTADITTTSAITTSGITSTIDLNGKTLTIGAGDNKFNDASNITIKNGNVSITGVTVNGNAIFRLDEYEETLVTTLTLNDVNLVGNGYSSAYGIFYIGDSSVLNVNGGVWNLKNDASTAGGVFKADASAATLNIAGLQLTAHNVRRGVTYAATTIENSTIAFSGDADEVDAEMEHGFNRSPLAINNSTITMTDMVGRGITAENGEVTIKKSNVTMTNCQEATIDVRGNQTVTIDSESTVTLDKEPTVASGCTITGNVTVNENLGKLAKIGDTYYKTLAEAIAAVGAGDVIIELLADAALDYTAREAYGTDATTSLTINGNGKVLTLNQINSDWASIGLANAAAKVVIKDITISKTGYGATSGAWNKHAIIFSSNVEMNNVIVNNSVAVQNGATLENVTINEAGDYYGLWVSGNGQTVTMNGGTINAENGRGIKVADQYVDNIKQVTLDVTDITFKTAKKAAILVTSTAGASITAINVDITGVVADNANIAWVDEDRAAYYGEVTINNEQAYMEGGTDNYDAAIMDGEIVQGYYETLAAAIAAAQNGETVTILAGNYTQDIAVNNGITVQGETDAEGKNLVNITGRVSASTGATVKNLNVNNAKTGEYDCALAVNGKDIVIDGVMLTGHNAMRYCYATGDIAIKNSIINGSNFAVHFDGSEGGNIAFENCEITGWCSYASTVTAVSYKNTHLDNGNYAGHRYYNKNISFDECTFSKDMQIDLKASGTTVAFTNTEMTADEVKALFKDPYYVVMGNVTLNGDQITYVASAYTASGSKYFSSLQDAINEVNNGGYITVRSNITPAESVNIPAGKEVEIGLGDFNITAANENVNLEILGTLTMSGNGVSTFRNHWVKEGGKLVLDGATLQNIETCSGGYGVNIENGGEFVMKNGTVKATNTANYAVIVKEGGKAEINEGTVTGKWGAIHNGGEVLVKGGTIEVTGAIGGHCLYNAAGKATVKGGDFNPFNTSNTITSYSVYAAAGSVEISGGSFEAEVYGRALGAAAGATIKVTGGTYTSSEGYLESNLIAFVAEGYAALPNLNDEYVVGAKPTATVNNLGTTTITADKYSIWNGSLDQNTEDDGDMPLSFVMQFLADQDAEDMETSPFADWFGDFVITFTGIEGGSFTADGCYLAGHYGSFGWVKVPVDGMEIKEGARYPVMLGVGMGQRYDYICSGVEDFKCALYLTPEIIAANPNIKVNLELAIVYNSQVTGAQDEAKNALINNENVYSVTDYTYDADDFKMNVAKIDNKEYPTLADAVKAAQAGQTITLIKNAPGEGVVIDKSLTIDFNGKTYTFTKPVGSIGTVSNGFQILNGNTVTLKNGKLDVAASAKEDFYILIQNYANLTVEDMTLDGTNLDKWIEDYEDSYVLSNNSGKVNVTGSTSIKANDDGSKAFAFDAYKNVSYDAPVVTVNTTGTIEGAIEVSATLKLEVVGKDSDITRVDITGEGQLYNDIEGIQGTVKRTFKNNADGNAENDWYTIGLPFANHETTGLQTTSSAYALYRYNETDASWENSFNTLDLGRGYIYANAATTDVEFTGTFNVKPMVFNVTATNKELKGFNLVGNPFSHDITFEHLSHDYLAKGFYVLENNGKWQPRYAQGNDNNVIKAFQGALVQVAEEGELTIYKEAPRGRSNKENNGSLLINVANDNYSDVAYVSFNEGLGLNKINHRNANIPMVYVPVDGKNYAVATISKDVTEIPVSFEAKTMGEYTISVEAQDCEFATMTLIDRMTGEQTNLLLEDYTFMAKSNDNTERFVIRLSAEGMNSTSDNFAYISNNELYISCSSDNAVVEIYDVLGRPVVTYDVNKSANISTENFTNGIYIIRLVEENDVKVQKILID